MYTSYKVMLLAALICIVSSLHLVEEKATTVEASTESLNQMEEKQSLCSTPIGTDQVK